MPLPGQGGTLPGLDPSASGGGLDPASGSSGSLPGSPGGGLDPAGGGSANLPETPGGGDYTLDTLPGGGVFQGSAGTGQQGGDGGMTAAQRSAVLDEQLRRTYEVYDEILRREQAEVRGIEIPGGNSGGGSSLPGGGIEAGSQRSEGAAGGGSPNGPGGVEIDDRRNFPASPGGGRDKQQTFPPPEDIPSGRDDDVVARQLREAAMTEPDPVLREALWDEYRNYTGIATDR